MCHFQWILVVWLWFGVRRAGMWFDSDWWLGLRIKFVVETFSKIMNAKTFPMYLQGDVGVHKRLESSPSISGRTRSTSGSCSSWIASVSASCSKMWTVAIPGKGRSNCRKQTTSERFPGLFELSKLENNFANGFFSFWTYFHSFVSRILESK